LDSDERPGKTCETICLLKLFLNFLVFGSKLMFEKRLIAIAELGQINDL